jgi:hypothetical protein
MSLVLFRDGTKSRLPVYCCSGAALIGQPTAYVIRRGQLIWVVPGQSVEFVEAD